METNQFWQMIKELFSQKKYNSEKDVVLKIWDIRGQLVSKHYSKGKSVFIIYPN